VKENDNVLSELTQSGEAADRCRPTGGNRAKRPPMCVQEGSPVLRGQVNFHPLARLLSIWSFVTGIVSVVCQGSPLLRGQVDLHPLARAAANSRGH